MHVAAPKIIWIYWHQGLKNAPEVVKKCVLSWQEHNPSYEIRVLSDAEIKRYIDITLPVFQKSKKKSLAAYSDVLRINLLHKYGGIWVDSTVMCLRPLREWLGDEMMDFFAFANPGPDRMISSWFLIGSQHDSSQ